MDFDFLIDAELDERKEDGFRGERMTVLKAEQISEYITDPLVKRLYLTDVGFFPSAEYHFMERKDGCNQHIFLYCTEGEGTVIVNGKKYILHENEAFTIPRGQAHSYYSNKQNPWSILWVHFVGEDSKYYTLSEKRIVKFKSTKVKNRMFFWFELIFQVLERNYSLGDFIYISQVLSLVLTETYIREKRGEAGEQNRHVNNIVRYMCNNLGQNLTLEQICETFELSKSYVNSIFLKHMHDTPMGFFTNLKIREACNALRNTDRYIYEIAQSLGYRDQYYFSRLFKKVVGMSPKEYRSSTEIFYK